MTTPTKQNAAPAEKSFFEKFGLKAGIGKPTTPLKGKLYAGLILSVGSSPVKGKEVPFITLKDAENGEVESLWMDAGMKTALSQNGIIALTDNGYVVKNKEIIGLKHEGMIAIPGTTRTVNNYAVFVS